MTDEDWPPVPCFCGKAGCTEMYVSGTGFVADYLRTTGEACTGLEIMARVERGEAQAVAALARLQDRFARVVANLVNIIDPDVIVMGGGMGELPQLVEDLPPLVKRYSFSGSAAVKIVRAKFGAASGTRGAALLWPAS
jgi:fructokinase